MNESTSNPKVTIKESKGSYAPLAILPATTHYNIFFSPTLASTVTPFLDALMPQ